MKSICIIGKDARSLELAQLCKNEYEVEHYSKADIVVCPIPFTRDNIYVNNDDTKITTLLNELNKNNSSILVTGAIKEDMISKLEYNNIKYIDIMKNEEFVQKNAIATAEATIYLVMQNTNKTLNDMNIAVVGLGRIGEKIVKLLVEFGTKITVYTSKYENITDNNFKAKNYDNLAMDINIFDVVINTAPSIIIDENVLNNVNKDTVIIDIASGSGGTDFLKAKELGINVIWALSLPSKYAKISAAEYIKEEIDKINT